MGNKTGLITPFIMLVAGSLASVIMYIRKYEFTKMLWILLIVLVIFYIIGDIARYLYSTVRPTVVPEVDFKEAAVVAKARAEGFLAEDGTIIEYDEEAAEAAEAEETLAEENENVEDNSYSDEFYNEDYNSYSEENIPESEEYGEYEDFGEGYSDEDVTLN